MIFVFSFFTILNSALLSGFVAQIYRFSPFFRVSKRKLYFLTLTFYPLLPCFYSLTRVASYFASGRVRNRIPVPYIYYRYKEKTNLLVTPSTLKKSFCFFTLTPSLVTVTGWQTAIKSVRVSVRASFLPSHHPHTLMDKSCCNRMKNELLIRLLYCLSAKRKKGVKTFE